MPGKNNNPILVTAQRELSKHRWDHFVVGDTRSMAEGGRGTVTIGCAGCQLALQNQTQYMEHLCQDVLPQIVDDIVERLSIALD